MCIIAYKPAGVKMLEDKVLEACWNGNHDGAGFFIKAFGKVKYWKGFMKLADLKQGLKELETEYKDLTKHEVGIHFRIATHGGVSAGLTHPFPLTDDWGSMTKLSGSDTCVMHNGVITHGPLYQGLSDTASYILDCLYPLTQGTTIANPFIEPTINGSRMLITTSNQKTIMIGDWKKSSFGWHFSNAGYTYTSYYGANYGTNYGFYRGRGWIEGYGYDDDDDEWEEDDRFKKSEKYKSTRNEKFQGAYTPYCILTKNEWFTYDHDTKHYKPEQFLSRGVMEECIKCTAGFKRCADCTRVPAMACEAYNLKDKTKYEYLVYRFGDVSRLETRQTIIDAINEKVPALPAPTVDDQPINPKVEAMRALGYELRRDEETGAESWVPFKLGGAALFESEMSDIVSELYDKHEWLWNITEFVNDYYDPDKLCQIYVDCDDRMYRRSDADELYVELTFGDLNGIVTIPYDLTTVPSILVHEDKIVKLEVHTRCRV